MAEGSSRTLTCRDCGSEFARSNRMGRKPIYCPSCAEERLRRSAREYARKVYAAHRVEPQRGFTCVDCSQPFRRTSVMTSGQVPQRCPDCRKIRHKQVARAAALARAEARSAAERSARRERYEREGRWSTCINCGAAILNAIKGSPGQRCRPCNLAHWRAGWWRRSAPPDPQPIICVDCGTSVPVPRKGGRRERCNPCARTRRENWQREWLDRNRERVRERNRRREHLKRASMYGAGVERFNSREIYMRDRWICGICRKKINPKLRHPHPMSASLDHVIPLSEGGPHTRANTRAAHLRCNCRRSNRGGGEQLALIG